SGCDSRFHGLSGIHRTHGLCQSVEKYYQPPRTKSDIRHHGRKQGACVKPIISIEQLTKTYDSGLKALDTLSLDIQAGEIFALLGPNGAGKTTLISIVCGIVNASTGRVTVDGLDTVRDYREARKRIGLVPQELAVSMFESVWDTVRFSRGLFGRAPDDAYLE